MNGAAAHPLLDGLRHPLRALRLRIERWGQRHGRSPQASVTVQRGRIYILPTRFGLGFALMTLVMLLAATNYANSMAFALSFLLAALGLVSMHQTHANLIGLTLSAGASEPVFAGDGARVIVNLGNASSVIRLSVELRWADGGTLAVHDLPPRDTQRYELVCRTGRRGRHPLPMLRLSTEYPLGLFRAWTTMTLRGALLVYPQPAAAGPLPSSDGSGQRLASQAQAGQDDFAGFRDYRPGDSPRLIHWKSLPRTGRPLIKQFESGSSTEVWLSWQQTAEPDAEARLSRLARWVLDAEAAGARYGLRLPGSVLPPAAGAAHRAACLEQLALFDAAAAQGRDRAR